jgi:6-phosphofructokinase 1
MKALRTLNQFDIDGLVVIGGNGSQQGSYALHKRGFPVVGVASTIDNDLYGVDITIGVDTALNIALEAVDRLKITASSHQRAFLVEVMGRNCGYLALMSAIAGGAEAVVLPEAEITPEEIADVIHEAYEQGKAHAIVVVAEGAKCNATCLMEYFNQNRERLGFKLRTTILGHVQRGGYPGAFDRILGSRLGAKAVEYLSNGMTGVLTGLIGGEVDNIDLEQVISNTKEIDLDLFDLAKILD